MSNSNKCTPERRREIARLGGLKVSQNMSKIGKKGGTACAEKYDMSELGKKGYAKSPVARGYNKKTPTKGRF
jgi:general stress protein YciG